MIPEDVKSIRITVYYETNRSKGSNDFNTLQELKRWLDNHPDHAKALGYTKKN
jgi:hypothetical protein